MQSSMDHNVIDKSIVENGLKLCANNQAYSVYIDDTESENNIYRSVAVVIRPELSSDVHFGIQTLLSKFNVTEFHFKDIYHGKGEFKGKSIDHRLRIFNAFVRLISQELKPEIFIESSSKKDRESLEASLNDSGTRITLTKPKNFAMFWVIMEVWKYLRSIEHEGRKAIVFCDAGIYSPNQAAYIPFLDEIIYKKLIYFVDSKKYLGIQIADFVAFSLNRVQSLAQGSDLSELDKTFLLTIEPIYEFIKGDGIAKKVIKLSLHQKWHLPYIIRNLNRNEETIIIDDRTGLILLPKQSRKIFDAVKQKKLKK